MASKVKYTPTESGSIALGQAGAKIIEDGEGTIYPGTGAFVAITVLETGIVTAVAEDALYPTISDELIAGITIYGRWTSITATSEAKVIAYNG